MTKYKAWDKVDNKFRKLENIDYKNEIIQLSMNKGEGITYYGDVKRSFDEVRLLRYIDRYYANDDEMCEGDIVKSDRLSDKFQIAFVNGQWKIVGKDFKGLSAGFNWKEFKKIGNIMEDILI